MIYKAVIAWTVE